MQALAVLWGLAILMPYPALPLGSATGIQMAHLLIIALLPFALINATAIPRAWSFFLIISVPQVVSLLANGLERVDLNATLFNVFALLSIPVTALVFRFHPRALLSGFALMMCVHGAIGLLQFFAFRQNEFPLGALFVNPSFAPFTAEWQAIYAQYVKRPMGLFPEPSSLLAAVGPWLVLLTAALFDGSRQQDGQRVLGSRFLMLAAVALIGVLMTLSASGALLFVAGGTAVVLIVMTYRYGSRRPATTGLAIIAALVAGTALLNLLGTRADSEFAQSGGSWFERLASIRLGLELVAGSELRDLWAGYGAGQVALLAAELGAFDAVQSWVVSHVVANGLLGALGLVVCTLLLLDAVLRTADRTIWLICLAVWFVGPLVVTAYQDLFGVWAFIALPLAVADRFASPRAMLPLRSAVATPGIRAWA